MIVICGLNMFNPVLMIRWIFFGWLFFFFLQNYPSNNDVHIGQQISICPITANVNFVHLIQEFCQIPQLKS